MVRSRIVCCVVPLWECGSPFRKRFFYSPGIVSIVYYSYCK